MDETEILIVGAGIAGATTAYHLKRRSTFRIVLLEKEQTAGVHSTGRNAGLIREYMEDRALAGLATASSSVLRTGQLAHYDHSGAMLLGLGDTDVHPLCPRAHGSGKWCPQDGIVDVSALLQTYLSGQEVRFSTEVIGWEAQGHRLHVHTNNGDWSCRTLVNAAGPWAGVLGQLPLTPMGRHLFQTPPLDWVDPKWPFIWDVYRHYYFRPESGGLLLSPCDETPGVPGDYTEDPEILMKLAERLETHQPDLGEISILSSWVGHRTFAPDRRFVIGHDPRNAHIFHVAALGGHGITTSYAVGELAARMLTGEPTDNSYPFDPARLLR